MPINGQKMLPAVRNMKDFEKLLKSDYEYFILLDSHIAQVKGVNKTARQYGKKMILHVDLIQGIKSDEYAAEFLIQEIKPHGLISTRSGVIVKAKQKGVLAIQRLFLLDSHALEKSYELLLKTKPDLIEVLPGIMPNIIKEVINRTKLPIVAGGLIRSLEDVESALSAGAVAVTTSDISLWNHYEK